MKVLVTGSSGHLGEALMRTLPLAGHEPVGLDARPGAFTRHTGSICDVNLVRSTIRGADAVIHTATLHKPHVATHSWADFVDTNITGTRILLQAAVEAGVGAFLFTSTTSAFGRALRPPAGAPAAWIDEEVSGRVKNIYGATKTAAEDLCELTHGQTAMPVLVLRTSRFFPEEDDNPQVRARYRPENAKANEFLYRRVDLADAASAHVCALERAGEIGFAKYIISATPPFDRDDVAGLRDDAPPTVWSRFPSGKAIYESRGYEMFDSIDRVYSNARARRELGWEPEYDFARILRQLDAGDPIGSALAREVGVKGYHGDAFADGLYPVA
ncbi:NAD-dependent epimerase/dehydratase family protein [Marinicauda pacifica]|uniref:NAD-dependent epimerase/dehydratase family protein n=1 Tax=Marinicauda pacifica TaxID=1133559 RepID=UPI0035C7D36C